MAAEAHIMTQKEQKESGKDGKLLAWACGKCEHKSITPMYVCPVDKSRDIKTVEIPSEGVVEAFTVQKLIAPEEFINDIPFAFVVVKLDDGTRISGWVPDIARDTDLPLGSRVKHTPTYKPGFMFERA